MTRSVGFDSADGLGRIRLNRPGIRNAIDPEFVDDLHEAVQRCAADETVRALLIRGEGPSFTVGGDVAMLARTGPDELPATLRRMTTSYHAALQILDRLPVPVVAAVHGAVAGGGLGLIYVADIVLAAEGTRFTAGFGGPTPGRTPPRRPTSPNWPRPTPRWPRWTSPSRPTAATAWPWSTAWPTCGSSPG